MEMNVANSYSD